MKVLNPSAAYREISLLLKKIRGIRSSGKQVTLAARLPKRVLVQIFQEVCINWTEDYLEERGRTVLGHVCRSWRAAAFDIPRLRANGRHFSLEEKMIFGLRPYGYSATLHMDLDAKWTEIHRECIVQLIFNECDRMDFLHVTGTQACSIMQNARKPAPALMLLILDSGDVTPKKHRVYGSKKSPFVLSPGIFDGQTPELIHLSLTNIVIDLNSALLSENLSMLTLSRTNEDCPRLCSLPQLIKALSTMKSLTHLIVKDILIEPEDEASLDRSLSQLSPVYLLRLEALRLKIPSMQNYSGFLDKILFHAGSATCYLNTTINMSRIQGSHRILPCALPIDPPADRHFGKLSLCVPKPQQLSLYASGTAGSLSLNIEDSAAFTSLQYLCFHLRKPLSAVQCLSLTSGTPTGGQSWSLFWEHLSGVENICVKFWDLSCLMDALTRPNVFPKLARLEFPNLWSWPNDFFIFLADALEKRPQGSSPNIKLVVRNGVADEVIPCQMPEDLANLRQRSVPTPCPTALLRILNGEK